MINRRPSPKGKKNSHYKHELCFTGAFKNGKWWRRDGEAVRVQSQMNTMKNRDEKSGAAWGEKQELILAGMEAATTFRKDKTRRGFLRSSDGDGGPETEEADRWSCSSTDSLRVKLEPPTADCWTAGLLLPLKSPAPPFFFPLLFFCFVAAGGACTQRVSAAAGGETAS